MWTSALFGAKNFDFRNLYRVSARTKGEGGSASADILLIRGLVFRDFVRTSFTDAP